MRSLNISSHALGKAIPVIFGILVASFLIFFLIGFMFYKPPRVTLPHDSMTMPIERVPDEASPVSEDKNKEREAKEDEQLSIAAKLLPLLPHRVGKVRVATRYEGLLAQMDSVLDGMGPVPASDALEECWEGFMNRNENAPADDGIAAGVPLEVTIQERMVMIKDVLEYASSEAGIPVDLLAAVAWAETTIFPYAINVRGKTYYFTSRAQALKALKGIKTADVDIGLFQVNYRLWAEPLGLKKEDLLDTRVCAIMGALILKYNLQRHQDPWVAVGRYHSGDMSRMRAYQTKVSRGLEIIRTLSSGGGGAELSGMSQRDRRDSALQSDGRLGS
ncbi:MAG: lytic transglycosylase domain-containing protein [Desulfobacterales bacterium]|nr:lytic transglycosylase domain-containing protein [Desulfobacterales bacterium]